MTINKEQAVSDAMIEAGVSEAHNQAHRTYADMCRAIYLAMKAASHPLERQQAVSGDVVERLVREFEKIQGYKGDEHRTMARAALTASGMLDIELIAKAIHGNPDWWNRTAEDEKEMYREQARRVRTALQEEGVERRD